MKNVLAMLALCCISSHSAQAAGLNVRAFVEPQGGLYLEIPEEFPEPASFSYWFIIDDTTHNCTTINSAYWRQANEPAGVTLVAPANVILYLANSGEYYSRPATDREWTLIGTGTWLTEQWSKTTRDPSGRQVEQHLAWSGEGIAFTNDPRPGFERYWYMMGPSGCHTFVEKRRSYGPADIQTVELDSGVPGLPAWTLSTGLANIDALEVVGNWIY